jgi:hypothetical protein
MDVDNPEHVHDVCSRCSTIPADVLTLTEKQIMFTIEETVEHWDTSTCRLCRLLRESLPPGYPSAQRPSLYAETYVNERGVHRCCWEFFPPCDSDAGRFLYPRNIFATHTHTNTTNAHGQIRASYSGHVNFSLIRSWLHRCDTAHHSCEPASQASLVNLRVIDCESRAIIQARPDCSFVALSHVWGHSSQSQATTSMSLADTLPLTIRDSMVVTQELGYWYLWVDRLVSENIN